MQRPILSPLLVALAFAALACDTAPADPGDPNTSDDAGVADDSDAGSNGNPDATARRDAGTRPPDSGTIATSDSVEITVEPGDHAQVLLDAIRGARTSVHVTMYILSDSRFIDTLVARHDAGVEVKVLLNHDFPSGGTSNSDAYDTLHAHGVDVAWASSMFTYTHEKCVIIDGREAWIMTMNLAASSPNNREFLAKDTGADDVREAEMIFAADFSGSPATSVTGSLLVAPLNARNRMVALIASAQHTVDVEGEEFSDYQIVAALTAALGRGVAVRVVVASGSAPSSQTDAVAQVKAAGADVVATSRPYVHAKAIVVDGARAYVGSENFTTGSLMHNRELGIVTGTASAVSKIAAAIETDFHNGTRQ